MKADENVMRDEMDVEGLVSTLRCGKPTVFKPMEPDRCICTRCTAADVIERLCKERRGMEQTYRNQLSTSKGLLEQRDALARQLQEAEDMANVGRSLMKQIESNYDSLRGWHPLCDPAEIVVELINQRNEAESRLQEVVEERDRLRGLLRKRRAKITELRERLEKYEPPMWPSRTERSKP